MGTSRYGHFEKVWSDELQHTQCGYINEKFKEDLKSLDTTLYQIPLSQKFRPDLIAHKFYGTGKLYWVLVYANEINDTPAGFTTDRTIKIPNKDAVLGLI